MPTLNFFLYLLLAAGAFFFRLSYLGWFGPYLLAVIVAVPPLILLVSLPSMLGLRLGLSAQEQCLRGAPCRLCLSFDTRRILPVNSVRVRLELENLFTGERVTRELSYGEVGSCVSYIPLPTELCGRLSCRISSYECRDLLGLFSIRRASAAAARCTVMPASKGPEAAFSLDSALSSAVSLKPKYGGGFSEEHDLREYRPGDTVGSIHWKLSSKLDDVIVREPLINANDKIYLVLSKVGVDDRGLELLRWLSDELCSRELAHIIVSGGLHGVGSEVESAAALSAILSAPMAEPCIFDRSDARCVLLVSSGEVKLQ